MQTRIGWEKRLDTGPRIVAYGHASHEQPETVLGQSHAYLLTVPRHDCNDRKRTIVLRLSHYWLATYPRHHHVILSCIQRNSIFSVSQLLWPLQLYFWHVCTMWTRQIIYGSATTKCRTIRCDWGLTCWNLPFTVEEVRKIKSTNLRWPPVGHIELYKFN